VGGVSSVTATTASVEAAQRIPSLSHSSSTAASTTGATTSDAAIAAISDHSLMRSQNLRVRTPPDPRTGVPDRILDPLDWIHAITSQIPDPGQHLVRYYAWYSNRTRGRRRAQRAGGIRESSRLSFRRRAAGSCPTSEMGLL
jgi:hypothetical protein